MKTKSIVFAVIVFTQTTKSQNNFHKYYLEGQIGVGMQQKCPAAGMGGAFGFYITPNQSVDFRAREIYNFNNKVVAGAISITYRYHLKNGLFIGVGFGHHHELSEHDYMEHRAEAALGSHQHITHRSGVAVEAGYTFKPLVQKGFFNCVYPATSIMLTHMVMDNGTNPLITANFGIRIGLKKL